MCRVKKITSVRSRMLSAVLLALLAVSAAASEGPEYSYSPDVGSGSGSSYTLTGMGRITAIRIWETYSNYVTGIQFRYGYVWSDVAGYLSGAPMEIQLFKGEAIVQISGKYSNYLQYVVFTTNRGRFVQAGQPSGNSFNMYPKHSRAELVFISGRHAGPITSLGAHWAVVDPNAD
uniref:Jacalin-type lectin domain-containing protein n=2 Tax=Oryzias latipes TaxID=8090 RepID=A0A3P9I8N5_ORYLA